MKISYFFLYSAPGDNSAPTWGCCSCSTAQLYPEKEQDLLGGFHRASWCIHFEAWRYNNPRATLTNPHVGQQGWPRGSTQILPAKRLHHSQGQVATSTAEWAPCWDKLFQLDLPGDLEAKYWVSRCVLSEKICINTEHLGVETAKWLE